MASAAPTLSKNGSDTCVLCTSNYNRTRPSFCQCQHCSIPLCFDCMKEHHEALLQDVTEISHQYNELQQLIQTKQMMVVDETTKCILDVNQYFDTHIDQLRETQKKIIANMDVAKQNAQDHIRKVDADLRLIGGEIQGLAKESVVQTAKMKIVSTKLKEIEQHLNTYQVIKTETAIDIQPDISIKFDSPPAEIETAQSSDMEVNEPLQTQLPASTFESNLPFTFGLAPLTPTSPPKISSVSLLEQRPAKRESSLKSGSSNLFQNRHTTLESSFNNGFSNSSKQRPATRELSLKSTSSNLFEQRPTTLESSFKISFSNSSVVPKPSTISTGNQDSKKKNKSDSSDCDNDDDSDDTHIDTSDDVDRMASDGENIFYTTYNDGEPDCISYCCVDADDDDEDEHRCWNRSRIVDIIWWNSIKKFVCATKEGIHTVAYANKKFKITEAIHGKWSYVRVGANTNDLCLWIKSEKNNFRGIEIYSTEFELTRKIDFDNYRNEPFINESIGFCVTDKLIASIYTQMQKNNKILEVTFCDMNMNKSNSITLGECNRYTEIRTDGDDRFFITTGQRSFHIVASDGRKETIELENNGKWLAVLNDNNVAVSNGRADIQLVSFSTAPWHKTLFQPK